MLSRTTHELTLDETLAVLGELRPTRQLAPLQVEWLVKSASKLEEPAAAAPISTRSRRHLVRLPRRTRRMRVYNFRPLPGRTRTRSVDLGRVRPALTVTRMLAACLTGGVALGYLLL
jgi:hypothetical protein